MKALVLFHSPANPELKTTVADNERSGLALAKEGVRKDAESQLCWHILGMLQRAKKEYGLAGKSFGQALKADPVRALPAFPRPAPPPPRVAGLALLPGSRRTLLLPRPPPWPASLARPPPVARPPCPLPPLTDPSLPLLPKPALPTNPPRQRPHLAPPARAPNAPRQPAHALPAPAQRAKVVARPRARVRALWRPGQRRARPWRAV